MRSAPITALTFCICGLCATPAGAQTSIHGTGELSLSYNDNIQGTSTNCSDDDPDFPPCPIAAFVLSPAPGLVLFHDAPRMRFAVRYVRPFYFYFGPDVPSSASRSADMAGALGIFTLTPRDELTVGVFVNRFTPSLSALTAAGTTTAEATPAGDVTLLTAGLTQGLSSELTARWTLLQSAGFAVAEPIAVPEGPGEDPIEPPTTLTANFGIGPEYTIGNHAIAVLPSATYTRRFADAEAGPAEGLPEDAQVIINALARWRWDWTPSWGSELGAGVGIPFNDNGDVMFGPIASAAVLYAREGYAASLSYSRAITPSLLTGQTFYYDLLMLSGGIPLWEAADIEAHTSTGIAWQRVVDNDGLDVESDPVNTFLADVGVGWFPDEYPAIMLRYQRTDQFNAPTEQTYLPNFSRNIVTLSVGYMFPLRDVDVPTEPPTRVDRSDRDPTAPGGNEVQQTPSSRQQP